MKKNTISIFITLILLISIITSCVTNPVTYEDAVEEKKPLGVLPTIILGYVPFVGQLVQGEFIEAGVLAGAMVGGTALGIGTMDMDTGEMSPFGFVGASMMAGAIFYSWIDGLVTSIQRNKQYKQQTVEYAKDRAAELFIAGESAEAKSLIAQKVKTQEDRIEVAYEIAPEGCAVDVPDIVNMTNLNNLHYTHYNNRSISSLDTKISPEGFEYIFKIRPKTDVKSFAVCAALQNDASALSQFAEYAETYGITKEVVSIGSIILSENKNTDSLFSFYDYLRSEAPLMYLDMDEIEKRRIDINERDKYDQAGWFLKNEQWDQVIAIIEELSRESGADTFQTTRLNVLKAAAGLCILETIPEKMRNIDLLIHDLEKEAAEKEGPELEELNSYIQELKVLSDSGYKSKAEIENLNNLLYIISVKNGGVSFLGMTLNNLLDNEELSGLEKWQELERMSADRSAMISLSAILFPDLELSAAEIGSVIDEMHTYDYVFF